MGLIASLLVLAPKLAKESSGQPARLQSNSQMKQAKLQKQPLWISVILVTPHAAGNLSIGTCMPGALQRLC